MPSFTQANPGLNLQMYVFSFCLLNEDAAIRTSLILLLIMHEAENTSCSYNATLAQQN